MNAGELYVSVSGQGPAAILLHGNGGDHTEFDAMIPLLAREHTVYAPDSRGQGRNPRVARLSYDELADDLLCQMTRWKAERPLVIGLSDGGITALLAASRAPERFGSLVLCGANLNPMGLKRPLLRLFGRLARKTGDPLLWMMVREPYITDEMLARVTCPALVVAGQYDMIREAHTRHIASALPNARLVILPGESHGSYCVHSDKLLTLPQVKEAFPAPAPQAPFPTRTAPPEADRA